MRAQRTPHGNKTDVFARASVFYVFLCISTILRDMLLDFRRRYRAVFATLAIVVWIGLCMAPNVTIVHEDSRRRLAEPPGTGVGLIVHRVGTADKGRMQIVNQQLNTGWPMQTSGWVEAVSIPDGAPISTTYLYPANILGNALVAGVTSLSVMYIVKRGFLKARL